MNPPTNAIPQPRDENWLPVEFFENQRNFPMEELDRYAGKQIAWSLDGKQVVASADRDEELYEVVKSLGLNPSRVVFSYVDSGNDFQA